jgi:cold-inducible RNA-binding protein
MKRLFVGNLAFNTTEDELRQMFAIYGPAERVDVVTDYSGKPRGFGFVEMADASDADKAMAALNRTQVGGRTLNVDEARPRPVRAGRGGERGRSAERLGRRT